MKNQNIKSGLFGSIGENMVAFELAKRNWYVYRPYFDNRIDFIAQKFKIESKTLPSYIREILFFNLDKKDEKIIFDFYKKQERRRYERKFL